jgi:hypothetical protein
MDGAVQDVIVGIDRWGGRGKNPIVVQTQYRYVRAPFSNGRQLAINS